MNSKYMVLLLLLALFSALLLPAQAMAATAAGSSGTGLVTSVMAFFGDIVNGLLNIKPAEPAAVIPAPAASPRPASGKEVIGFYAEWWGNDTSSYNDMVKHKGAIGTIAPFWATLNRDATVSDRGGNDHAAVVSYARANGIQTLLLVNNEKGTGTVKPVHTVLSSPALRKKAIDNLEAYIKQYRLDGINIDFEEVPGGDRDHLTAFMRELADRLKPQGYLVTIDVFPKHNEEADIARAYDYAKLAAIADKIMLMTYDYHGAWSGPGAVADIAAVERDLQYALRFIPKNKLYLGVPGYGYDWSDKGVESLEYSAVQALVSRYKPSVQWDDATKSPHFAYTDANGSSHTVWFENSHSLRFKLDLVNKYDLAGIALWKLGEEDQAFWPLLQSYFRQ
ncbi:MAG: glycosyl hydrolase family 18 protein [Sporomusaceae bacterium]|nr:glycosyl hydrolase family 18 protein [Sporomusaceae bacterium]